MQIFFFVILAFTFLYSNTKIILCDQKFKKIPNKYLLQLLCLLPFWYLFLYFFSSENVSLFSFFLQIFISFFISFLLFSFKIWRAWDAKYLLILACFLPYISIISFIGNLGLLTLGYLFFYFLWFFIGRSIFIKWKFQELTSAIKSDFSDRWQIYKKQKWEKNFLLIFKWIIGFLIIFTAVRLLRVYIFQSLFSYSQIHNFFIQHHFYAIFWSIFMSFLLFYIFKKIKNFFFRFFPYTKKYNFYFLLSIFFILITFIGYEFYKNPQEISRYLLKIFTIYLIFYIFAKILLYGYKISFLRSESIMISLWQLHENHQIDKNYLHKIFSFRFDEWEEKIKQIYDETIKKFSLKNIKNLIRIYNNNELHQQRITKKERIQEILVIKTFSFGIYIFIGFLITFFFGNTIIEKILQSIFIFISK